MPRLMTNAVAALRISPLGLHGRRWLWLFVGARLAAAIVSAGLFALRPFAEGDWLLATAAMSWGVASVVCVHVWPWLMGRPAAWLIDVAACLLLVVASGDWRSPCYLLAVTALIPPATSLRTTAAVAAGLAFALTYFLLALSLGIEWSVLASTARLESFTTHLLIPLLVVGGLAHGTRLLNRLDRERERAEALALEGERRRIGWELHDSAKQRIHAAHLVLSSLGPALERVDAERLRFALGELDGAAAELDASLAELRTTLGGLRLDEAVSRRAGELQAASGVEIEVRGHAPSLPTFAAVHAYRVASEAVTNAIRHADASRIEITFLTGSHEFVLTVRDNGNGIAEHEESTGLESMRSRARMLGGHLRISRAAPHGTRVELRIPTDERR
jgi:signal transduction histidine kinase